MKTLFNDYIKKVKTIINDSDDKQHTKDLLRIERDKALRLSFNQNMDPSKRVVYSVIYNAFDKYINYDIPLILLVHEFEDMKTLMELKPCKN